ncbi:MAG TPA: sensor histidine kinase [Azospirillaceae bacterium]|nr:sensor histidine kinase [Azospirillaceae bacterium]
MIPAVTVASVSFAYVALLFAIASWADRRALRAGGAAKLPGGGLVYALSLAVFCTTWTFYGSVGRAAEVGVGFLPTYLGPTLVMTLGFTLLLKLLRVARRHRSTSIADFIATRYGRSPLLGGMVALVAVVGITPYIALQLKAVSLSFEALTGGPAGTAPAVLADTAFWIALLMAAFAIVFGTRSIDASEHHPGLMAAVAFESIVKLLAFLAVGVAVVYFAFDGPADITARALEHPEIARLFTAEPALADGGWVTVMLLSMAAMLCLPRQFQVLVVENTDERHLGRALWVFPLYLLLINLFVLPLAFAGLLLLPRGTDPDMMVLALPMLQGWEGLALLVFIGGLSAGTSMIIVETVALATMASNDLVLPWLLRFRREQLDQVRDLGRLMLTVRRIAIVLVLLLGYLYFRAAGSAYGLVSIGLISMAAVAQFAPALVGGLTWKGATRGGAVAGIAGGVAVWAYTLLLPSFARSGWLPAEFVGAGPWEIWWLRPYALLGLRGMDPLAHSLFWSMVVNIGLFVAVSLTGRVGAGERAMAAAFVEAYEPVEADSGTWRGAGTVGDLRELLTRFLGEERARAAFDAPIGRRFGAPPDPDARADAELVRRAERLLAGAIGAASARVAVASAVGGKEVGAAELMRMLDETSQVIEYSRRLEQKSAELERATAALREANERLRELDRLKDDFLSTVTHELRTPLTSVRALSELLHDTPDMDLEQRQEFLATIIKESERLTRLINQVLDMAKIEAGEVDWDIRPVELAGAVHDAVAGTQQLFADKGVDLSLDVPNTLPRVMGDHDRLVQVVLNLLSNAVKFAPAGGRAQVTVKPVAGALEVAVADNGPGIAPEDRAAVFERFRQVGSEKTGKPQGTGLGLAICKRLVDGMGGRIRAESAPGGGALFRFTVPLADARTPVG